VGLALLAAAIASAVVAHSGNIPQRTLGNGAYVLATIADTLITGPGKCVLRAKIAIPSMGCGIP
jgi:hypothetical protein